MESEKRIDFETQVVITRTFTCHERSPILRGSLERSEEDGLGDTVRLQGAPPVGRQYERGVASILLRSYIQCVIGIESASSHALHWCGSGSIGFPLRGPLSVLSVTCFARGDTSVDDRSPREPVTPVPEDPTPMDGMLAPLPEATREMLLELYQELRNLAERHLLGERSDHTLQPTALLHEAYVRLHSRFALGVTNRVHLMALISRTMRRVLVDHARADRALKRPGQRLRVTFHQELRITDHGFEDLLDLHLVLERYKQIDPRAAQIAEWLLFGGFTQAEVASHLGLGERTIRSEYAVARAWMRREIAGESVQPGRAKPA